MRRTVLLAVLALLPGCCFIGCDEEVMFSPAARISVTDEAGNPIPDAVVTLARYEENPHFRPLDSWQSQAGPNGKASFEYKRGTVTQYPMMMHGVGTFAWQYCAEAPGYATAVLPWNEAVADDVVVELSMKLGKGESDPCSEVIEFEPRDAPHLACARDEDCTYAEIHASDCCEVCYGSIVNTSANTEAKEQCAGKAPANCTPCEGTSFRDAPPRCLAGTCREPK